MLAGALTVRRGARRAVQELGRRITRRIRPIQGCARSVIFPGPIASGSWSVRRGPTPLLADPLAALGPADQADPPGSACVGSCCRQIRAQPRNSCWTRSPTGTPRSSSPGRPTSSAQAVTCRSPGPACLRASSGSSQRRGRSSGWGTQNAPLLQRHAQHRRCSCHTGSG